MWIELFTIMRKILLILLVLLIGAAAYGYLQNPVACKKLANDLATDLPPILTPTPATSKAINSAWSTHGASLLNLVVSRVLTNTPSTTEPAAEANSASDVTPAAATNLTAETNQATATAPAAAMSPANPPLAPIQAVNPTTPPPAANAATAEQLAALAAWTPPPSIPSNADWVWTTSKGVFRDIQIVKIEADCVTIIHRDGGGLVPISELPLDIRRQLNYNPDAAAAAAAQRQQDDIASEKALEKERGRGPLLVTDYPGALAAAKSSGKLVMLHFTGSDWCPYCKMLESEVLSTPTFGDFAGANYVFLTVDFPHNTPQADDVKQQNQALARKFGVTGYPTLVVIDSTEREVGRVSGYNPGSGPGAVISQLKAFSH